MIGRARLKELREVASKKLAPVNEFLKEIGIPRGHLRKKAGVCEQGEVQLLGVSKKESHTNVGGLLASVLYNVKAPFTYENGDTTFEMKTFRVNHNNGMIVIPVLNGTHVLMNKQYRFPVQSWVTELPRCFTRHPGPDQIQVAEISSHYRYEWFFDQVKIVEWTWLGSSYQNTGTDSAEVPVYVLELEGDEEKIREYMKVNFNSAHSPSKFYLRDLEELREHFSKRKGISAQDILAWHFAREKLEDIMEVC